MRDQAARKITGSRLAALRSAGRRPAGGERSAAARSRKSFDNHELAGGTGASRRFAAGQLRRAVRGARREEMNFSCVA